MESDELKDKNDKVDPIAFAEALRLRDEGRLHEALNLIEQLIVEHPGKYKLLLIAAEIHWDLGTLDGAVNLCQLAIGLRPESEWASLGLFHSLWKMGKKDEALNEMKRFVSISHSEDYAEIIGDLSQFGEKD